MRTRQEQEQQLAALLVAGSEGWTQVWAAARMRVRQGSVSDLRRGKLDRLSLEWLIRATIALGYDISITAVPSPPPARAERSKARPTSDQSDQSDQTTRG